VFLACKDVSNGVLARVDGARREFAHWDMNVHKGGTRLTQGQDS